MRGLAVAAVAVIVVGTGAYTWCLQMGLPWFAHYRLGKPRITADKDPVKGRSRNSGGKVVPNQDKAVYDRVTGDAAPAPNRRNCDPTNSRSTSLRRRLSLKCRRMTATVAMMRR